MTLIEGKTVSAAVKARIKAETERRCITPCLAVIIVGSDPASRVYVNNKKKACEATGMRSLEFALPEETSEAQLLSLIDRISPEKDVDCFHPVNVGKLWTGGAAFLPCTPAGVIELLRYYKIDCAGKNCVIIGRSNIVGKPMAALMLQENATVTVCHSKTKDLAKVCAGADILICAIGKPKFVTADMVKEGAAVIDVGINRDENGALCGDVDFESVSKKAGFLTPVPGGCGPMTIAMLMQNTLAAFDLQQGQS